MGNKIYQVDAFTDTPFTGNPAAVCLLSEPKDETWMQKVAYDMILFHDISPPGLVLMRILLQDLIIAVLAHFGVTDLVKLN